MTKRNQNIIILLSLLTLLCVAFFLLFEIKEVPNVKWNQNYQYESKDPYGGWTFQQLIYKSFGDDNVSNYTDIDSFETHDKQLYINYGSQLTLPLDKQSELIQFLSHGNSILFICDRISSQSDSLNDIYFDHLTYQDSMSHISFNDRDSSEYEFTFYTTNIDTPSESYKRGLIINHQSDSIYQHIAQVSDSLSIFYKRKLSIGNVFMYKDPYNFSNIAATQADYLDHFNHVFSYFDAETVILDRPRQSDILQSQHGDKSPLQYILSQPALAWGYYICLLGILLYVIFRGKRKQRIIPLSQINHNTSLEYVETISQLFLSQKQNRKLVEHIESVFYHNVKKKYYLDHNNSHFAVAFAQKSKIDKNDISYVLDKFKNARDGFEFTDDQLHSLYKKLELIYTKWK